MIDGVTFGRARPIEQVTLADVLEHPIWMWALDEETVEGRDETWTRPVTSTRDVGAEIVHFYPSLAFKLVGTGLYGFGDYAHADRRVQGLLTWRDGRQVELADAGMDFPVILEAMATILGKPGVRFRLETPGDVFARRID